jgi:hypothetical protein
VRETQVLKVWASEAKQLVLLNEEEFQKRKKKEFEAMQKASEEQRERMLIGNLSFDCLVCIINQKERKKAISRHRTLRAATEHSLLSGIQSERRITARESHLSRRADVLDTLKEGGPLLERLGGTNECSTITIQFLKTQEIITCVTSFFCQEMIHKTYKSAIKNEPGDLLQSMQAANIDTGRHKGTDSSNKLHRKITFNALDMSPSLYLTCHDLTGLIHLYSFYMCLLRHCN